MGPGGISSESAEAEGRRAFVEGVCVCPYSTCMPNLRDPWLHGWGSCLRMAWKSADEAHDDRASALLAKYYLDFFYANYR